MHCATEISVWNRIWIILAEYGLEPDCKPKKVDRIRPDLLDRPDFSVRGGKGREEKGKEGKVMEGKVREGKVREGKRKGRERKGKERKGKGRKGKGKEGKGK